MLKDHTSYNDIGSEEYDKKQRERELTNLKRKATQLGYTLAPKQT